MTREEVIETLEIAKAEVEWEYPLDYAVAIEMALSELKKGDKNYDVGYVKGIIDFYKEMYISYMKLANIPRVERATANTMLKETLDKLLQGVVENDDE